MSIQQRTVKNKRNTDRTLSGKPGTVYDVSIMYKAQDGAKKCYHKKGFLTEKEALQHEASMAATLRNPGHHLLKSKEEKMMLSEYLLGWLKNYAKTNVRPTTYQGYKSNIVNHINPNIGSIRLVCLMGRDLDGLYKMLLEDGLASNTVRYVHRTLSVALEHAKKHEYISSNPAKNVITKFSNRVTTPQPYTVEQTRILVEAAKGTHWETIIVLSALYGLRRGEVLGLKLQDVNLKAGTLTISRQRNPVAGGELFAPVKEDASNRTLPITACTKPFFERRIREIERQKREQGEAYCNGNMLVCKPDGRPYEQTHISREFNGFLCHTELPHIRFHDLRHTAATNLHEATGDFFSVSKILGHSTRGMSQSLNIGNFGRNATDGYIYVRENRLLNVLDAYHKNVLEPVTQENVLPFSAASPSVAASMQQ